jgi:hypothetical protein
VKTPKNIVTIRGQPRLKGKKDEEVETAQERCPKIIY